MLGIGPILADLFGGLPLAEVGVLAVDGHYGATAGL
jgi:hypothetical protein